MLTENEVRRRVDEVEASDTTPMRKVRGLLRLIGALRLQARALLHARAVSAQASDRNTLAHFDRMIRAVISLYEDVRQSAYRIFAGEGALPVSNPVLA